MALGRCGSFRQKRPKIAEKHRILPTNRQKLVKMAPNWSKPAEFEALLCAWLRAEENGHGMNLRDSVAFLFLVGGCDEVGFSRMFLLAEAGLVAYNSGD